MKYPGRMSACRNFFRIILGLAAGFVPLMSWALSPHRVLILDQGDFTRPFVISHTLAIRVALTEDPMQPVEIYAEGLDIDRFPGHDHKLKLIKWLTDKYSDRKIDAIITAGPDALDFAIQFRASIRQQIPIVFTAIEDYYVGRMVLPPGVTGVAAVTSFDASIQLARKLVPDTERIVILGDAGSDGSYLVDIERQFVGMQIKQDINIMTGMPVATILSRISSLPEKTIILYLGITTDSTGQFFLPHEILSTIASTANRPIFVTTDSLVGYGTVGGLIIKSTDGTREVADLTRRILNGEDASRIPVLFRETRKPVFDARALTRWGIRENLLPDNSELLFHEPSLWEEYSWQIVVIVMVVILQAALILALVIEYRRRRRVELQFRRTMSNLAHLNRTTALGELSASIAHELNQPLAAILTNTEAAEVLIGSDPPSIAQVKEALIDIRRDNQRASDIIRTMRSLFQKTQTEPQIFDLNNAIREILRFLAWEARSKDVAVVDMTEPHQVRVMADRAQLNQVILNLLMNALEAAQHNGERSPQVTIGTAVADSKMVEVYVEDSGPGVPPEILERIFDSYFTTKTQGMGMGLSISRTIIEAHGSRLYVTNLPGGGTRFRFALAMVEEK